MGVKFNTERPRQAAPTQPTLNKLKQHPARRLAQGQRQFMEVLSLHNVCRAEALDPVISMRDRTNSLLGFRMHRGCKHSKKKTNFEQLPAG